MPVLSQRDAEEWRTFYKILELDADCNVEDNSGEDNQCYKCPIVYGTVETFARDILKTEFLLQDARKGRKCDIVIVDEVDSMMIDQGIQCTYLSHEVGVTGMHHFEPILAFIWMHVSLLTPVILKNGVIFHWKNQEVFFITLARLNNEIDPLELLRMAEDDERIGIVKGFTDKYISHDIDGKKTHIQTLGCETLKKFLLFAVDVLNLDIDIYGDSYEIQLTSDKNENVRTRISITTNPNGVSSVILPLDMVKDRLIKLITAGIVSEDIATKLDLPLYLRDFCRSQLRYWIDNAFLANDMKSGREYIVKGNAIYPVDYKSTGVIETNKKWGDGLQQFLEMKHGLPRSPLSLITNFLSNIDFFERYESNIVGVSGTLGNDADKHFMSDTFAVEFATIPTSKQRKLFELDGVIVEYESELHDALSDKVESAIANQRAVLVICEDISTAVGINKHLSRNESNTIALFLLTESDSYGGDRINKALKPGDVVITTNLGARGSDFVTDEVVNKNGGMFVLVTFIPLNDRVEKQAFGRTGRRGATGSCQIIATKDKMPEWLRLCETIDEVKRLRDSIEMHRWDKTTEEVDLMRNKQTLFREYCQFKMKFVTSSNCDSDDLKIQNEILDETWAKWIHNYETMDHESNFDEIVHKLRRVLEDCSEKAKQFESDNIYHILKFGAVRLMKDDFEGAIEFYDRVIRMDPAWSAFAHYNGAYCMIQLKGDGYIRRAIDDLNAALCKLETYTAILLFSDIHADASTIDERFREIDNETIYDGTNSRSTNDEDGGSAQYYISMECQFVHHVDTQIIECIEKLERIDTLNEAVITERQDILESIPGADSRTNKMLQTYAQLGLLFTYNIDKKQTFCYRNQILISRFILKSLADTVMMAFSNGILMNGHSIQLKNMVDELCSIGTVGDGSTGWMARCVSRVIITGIHSIDFIRDVSSLVQIKQTELKSRITKTSQFTDFASSQAKYVLECLAPTMLELQKLLSSEKDEFLLSTTNVVMNILGKKIELLFHENMKPGQKLHQQLCCLYGNYASQSWTDHQQYVNCVNEIAQLSMRTFHLLDADVQTSKLHTIAVELSRNGSITVSDLTSVNLSIAAITEEIEIGNVIQRFSDWLIDQLHTINQRVKAGDYLLHDKHLPAETSYSYLKSVCNDIIRAVVQCEHHKLASVRFAKGNNPAM